MAWRKRKKTHRQMTLRRFLVIYGVFVAVLFCMLLPAYAYVQQTVQRIELERCQSQLQDGVNALEKSVGTMRNLAVTTESDYRFTELLYRDTAQDSLTLKYMSRVFSGLLFNDELICDAGLILRNGVVFTRQRMFFSDIHYRFYPDYFCCAGMDEAQFRQMIGSVSGSFIPEMRFASADHSEYSALLYISKWPVSYQHSECCLFATVKTEDLYGKLADPEILKDASIRITSQDGKTLAERASADTHGYQEISCVSRDLKMTFALGIDPAVLNTRLAPVKRVIWAFVFCLCIGAVTAIVFFAWHSARPMRELVTGLTGILPEEATAEQTQARGTQALQQDYRFIARNIKAMDDRMKTYLQTIEIQQQKLCSGIWERALMYGLYTESENRQFLEAFPDFPEKWRLMMIRLAENGGEAPIEDRAKQQFQLYELLNRTAEAMVIERIEDSFLSVLLKGDKIPQTKELESEKDILSCAVSEVCSSPNALHYACQQTFDLIYLNGENLPFLRTLRNAASGQTRLPFTMQDEEVLYKALRSGNLKTSMYLLQNSEAELKKLDDAGLWRFVYQQIVSIIARLRLENPGALFHVIIPVFTYQNREELFASSLPDCFEAVCASFDRGRQGEGKEIEQYILEHLSDAQLSVAQLTDVFHLSSPTLQKVFRSETGLTIASYIDKARIDMAQHLLSETWLSVGEITRKCGYMSTNTFSKAFKRYTGVSPSTVQRTRRPPEEEKPRD